MSTWDIFRHQKSFRDFCGLKIQRIFKQKKETSGDGSLEKAGKKIEISELNALINEELKSLEDKSKELGDNIKNLANEFSLKIKEKIPFLKLINLDEKREQEKLKAIVMTNLFLYISSLETLAQNIEKINNRETKEYLKSMEQIFNQFSKNSSMSFEKATILIGKELADVKSIISDFVKSFYEKTEANKWAFDKITLIEHLKASLNELENLKNIQKEIEDNIEIIENKIVKIEKEKKKLEEDYKMYKQGKEYAKFIEEQEKIKEENNILDKDIQKLKQDMDIKFLSKHFHDDIKKSKTIKNYQDNFMNALKNDDNLEIIEIIKQSEKQVDIGKIKEIKKRIEERKSPAENEEDEKSKDFNNKIKHQEHDLINERIEMEKEGNKKLKFEQKQKQIMMQIKEEVGKIWNGLVLES